MHFHAIISTALGFSMTVLAASNLKSRQSSTTQGDSKCFTHMCVAATVNGSNVDYVLTSTGKADVGYMAVGFGSQMSNSPMVILWGNDDGSITLSQRIASGHDMPQVQGSPTVKATLEPGLSAVSATTPSYAFSVPSDSTSNVRLIYAFSDSKPGSSAEDATIQQHLTMGTTSLDLSKVTTTSPPGSTPSSGGGSGGSGGSSSAQPLSETEKYIVAHGILSVIGFLFLLPLGTLLARYFRTFTNSWFTGHLAIQFYLAGPVIVTAFALGVASVSKAGGEPLNDDHKKWGVAIFVLYIAQFFLGFFIHYVKSASGRRPPQNYFHAVFGILIVGLAYYQVRSGYKEEWTKTTGRETPNAANIVWYVWIVIIPVLYLAGLAFLPKQFRQEKAYRSNKSAGGHS